ncbi:hypothetical protein AJ80_10071, partial [Polytolypa hystricis UAMH7299]
IQIYAYIFTNLETQQGYKILFTKLFKHLGNAAQQPVQFGHIHGGDSCIHAVTVDMCMKQAPGFGDFLHDLDPSKTWSEHLQHTVIFCQTHVQRNFFKKFKLHPARYLIDTIWDLPDTRDVVEHLDTIAQLYPKLKKWIDSKKKDWILAGLSAEHSCIPMTWQIYTWKYTGISKSSYFADNEFIRYKQILLAAVL